MKLVRQFDPSEITLMRWAARGLSLLLIGFVLILLVLNDDFRESPTLPVVILWMLTFCILIAWRWERAGGMLILAMSLLIFLSLLIQWLITGVLTMPLWQLAPIGFALIMPYVIVGWLFLYLGLIKETASEHGPRD